MSVCVIGCASAWLGCSFLWDWGRLRDETQTTDKCVCGDGVGKRASVEPTPLARCRVGSRTSSPR